jgi:hypothetical protein
VNDDLTTYLARLGHLLTTHTKIPMTISGVTTDITADVVPRVLLPGQYAIESCSLPECVLEILPAISK